MAQTTNRLSIGEMLLAAAAPPLLCAAIFAAGMASPAADVAAPGPFAGLGVQQAFASSVPAHPFTLSAEEAQTANFISELVPGPLSNGPLLFEDEEFDTIPLVEYALEELFYSDDDIIYLDEDDFEDLDEEDLSEDSGLIPQSAVK